MLESCSFSRVQTNLWHFGSNCTGYLKKSTHLVQPAVTEFRGQVYCTQVLFHYIWHKMLHKMYSILKYVPPHRHSLFFLEEINSLSSPFTYKESVKKQLQENLTSGLA